MGDKFRSLLNVTIVYPDGIPGFWEFLSGRVKRITVRVQNLPIPKHFIGGDYENDAQFRAAFQQWLHEVWLEKDGLIAKLHDEAAPA